MKFGKEFCNYITGYALECGMYCKDLSGRCDKHKGKENKKTNPKAGHYSGDSKWRSENGMYQGKKGR